MRSSIRRCNQNSETQTFHPKISFRDSSILTTRRQSFMLVSDTTRKRNNNNNLVILMVFIKSQSQWFLAACCGYQIWSLLRCDLNPQQIPFRKQLKASHSLFRVITVCYFATNFCAFVDGSSRKLEKKFLIQQALSFHCLPCFLQKPECFENLIL